MPAGSPQTLQNRLQRLYDRMLQDYSGGISNTSTKKFDPLKSFFAEVLNIPETEVYITGAGTRPTNLEVRLTQGLQATKHTVLGLGFLVASNEKQLERISESALVTIEKFLGRKKASYDAIGILVQIGDELRFTRVLETQTADIGARLKQHFPTLVVRTIKGTPSSDSAGAAAAKGGAQKGRGAARWPDTEEADLTDLIPSAIEALRSINLVFPEELVQRFCAALLTKRFVILTGLTGSGKTKLAHAFGRWIAAEPDSQCKILAVGADWTSNQQVFGYPDALNNDRYETTPALDFILEAANEENQDRPFFLILDEMNLSHVERYFSDFLSAIETGKEIDLYSGEDRGSVPQRLSLPSNLYIVGTVNVDETTYMFSPKVLDRANVLEFKVSMSDMATFLENPVQRTMDGIDAQGSDFGNSFVEETLNEELDLSEEEMALLRNELLKWFSVMEKAGWQFGFRTTSEIVRFVHNHKRLAAGEWRLLDAFDAQVIQKILPRLHGSRTTMEPLIWALLRLSYENIPMDENKLDELIVEPMLSREAALDPQQLLDEETDLEILKGDAHLKLSFEKLWRMSEKVKEGFINSADI
jgi:hypothetical protein